MPKKPPTPLPNDLTERVRLRLEQRFPRNLHKDYWEEGEIEEDLDKPRRKAAKMSRKPPLDKTLYRWWWEFQKAASDHPRVKREVAAKRAANRADIEENDGHFRDLGDDFETWWNAGGQEAFREIDIPLLQVIGPKTEDSEFYGKSMMVVIPLTISRELIIEQVWEALEVYHPKEKLRRHEHSTAPRPLYAKQRQRETPYGLLVNVWREQEAHLAKTGKPEVWWKIYCRAIGKPELIETLGQRGAHTLDQRLEYGKKAQDLYEQADELVRNAIRGEFPNDDRYQARKHPKKRTPAKPKKR